LYRELAQVSGRYDLRQDFLEMAQDMPELLNTLVRHPIVMIVVSVGAFLLFIGETVGTAQELGTGTNPSDRAAMELSRFEATSDPPTGMQNGQATASPGRWLIDDVARERAEFEHRQVSPKPLSATTTTCIEAPVGAAPEGERWYYRLDRETRRKCWHVRTVREERAQRSIVESDRRQSEPTSPGPPIRLGLGGTGNDR
jgi:hypothetical protein